MLILFTHMAVVFAVSGINYAQVFGDAYHEAVKKLDGRKTEFTTAGKKYSGNEKIARSIVFPEGIRYSMLSDLFETVYLETVYVEKGSAYADFSIGEFQMKPSFVETLEKEIASDEALKKSFPEMQIAHTDAKQARKERLSRLKVRDWQMKYLFAFYKVGIKKYNLDASGDAEKLKYLATAYNYGIKKTKAELEILSQRKTFPYGADYGTSQYAYSDIAAYYFNNEGK